MSDTSEPNQPRHSLEPWVRKFVIICLLVFGVELWLTIMHGRYARYYEPWILAIAILLSLILRLSRWIDGWVTRWDGWLARRRGMTAVVIGVGMFFYLYSQPVDPAELFLKFHDEHSYMIQAHMLARGRLWMPAYPAQIAPFFDNFHMIVDRVYASIYFPGTALLLTPGIWLNLPFWAMPTLEAAIAGAFFYLVFQDIFGGVRGLLATLMLASLFYYRHQAQMVLSEIPFLLGAMILVWSWLRWRDRQNWKWMIPLGGAAGFAAITRPMDALCFALPVGIAILAELRPRTMRKFLVTAVTAIVAASPFLGLQIVQNIGVTGNWRVFPSDYYVARNYPAPMLGFYHVDEKTAPVSSYGPKEQALRNWIIPAYEQHTLATVPHDWIPMKFNKWQPERTYGVLLGTLPNTMMIVIVPCAVLGLSDIRRKVLGATLVLFVFGYAAYVFFLAHYMVPVMPAMIGLILMGWEALASTWPRARAVFVTMMLLSLGGLSIGALPQLDVYNDPMLGFPETRYADETLALMPQRPTLVLFRFDPKHSNYNDEPDYNDGVAFPDEALIIKAHDLGATENKKLFEYYAQRQPDRVVYLYDRSAIGEGNHPLTRLGMVSELAAQR